MKLTISREKLMFLLANGGSTLGKNPVIAILNNARLTAAHGVLRLATSDLDKVAEAIEEVDLIEPGSTTVDATRLKSIAANLPNGAAVSLSEDDGDLIIKSGRSRVRLATLPVEEWPAFDDTAEGAAHFQISGADIDKLFTRAAQIAQSAVQGSVVEGVFLHVHERRLGCVGTNGAALFTTTTDLPEGADAFPLNGKAQGARLAVDTVQTALRLFKTSAEPVDVYVTDRKIIFETQKARLAAKLLEGIYPDFHRIIPPESANTILVDRARALASASLLETFATKDMGHKVECGPVENGLAFAAGASSNGDGVDVIDAEIEGSVPRFGLSSLYLKQILGAFKSETLTLTVRSPAEAIRFSATNEDGLGLISPMKIDGRLLDGVTNEQAAS